MPASQISESQQKFKNQNAKKHFLTLKMLSFLYLPKEKWGQGLQLECDGELMGTRKPDQMLWAMIYGTESLKTLILVCLGHLGKGWWPANLLSPLLTCTLEELMVKMVRQSFSLLVSCCANLPFKRQTKKVLPCTWPKLETETATLLLMGHWFSSHFFLLSLRELSCCQG